MTSQILEWLLGLDQLRPGDADVAFGFERPFPAWAWLLALAATATLGWASYRKLEGSKTLRTTMAAARAALLLLIFTLIAGPQLIRPNETEEPDWVLVLLDRSMSLSLPDSPAPQDSPNQQRIPREQQLRSLLENAQQTWSQLAESRTLAWFGFDAATYELALPPDSPTPELTDPDGLRTRIGAALRDATRAAAARPIAGIVLLSDGQSADDTDTPARELANLGVPVFPVPLGSTQPVTDVGVRSATAPAAAFVGDDVPIQIELDRFGDDPASPTTGTVRLIDRATGRTLDEQRFGEDQTTTSNFNDDNTNAPQLGTSERPIILTYKPEQTGELNWAVEIITDGPDLVEANNTAELNIELFDRPLRVVYFDGYPRWERRFITTLLLREPSVTSSSVLLSPGRTYLQEGDILIDRLPNTPEDWRPIDVIIMGDIRPEMLTAAQQEQIRQRVGTGGAGLLWIAGETAPPAAWADSPLADLLPVRLAATASAAGSPVPSVVRWTSPIVLRPAPAADRLGVLRLSSQRLPDGSFWPDELSDPHAGWSSLWWALRIDPLALKPGAETLALAQPADSSASTDTAKPVVLTMRYGAGRVIYVGTDELWRWRYGRGEDYNERFWLPLIRLLGRESLARSVESTRLRVTPRRAQIQQPVSVRLELLDQTLLDADPQRVGVRVVRIGTAGAFTTRTDHAATTAAAHTGETVARFVLTPETGSSAATDPNLDPAALRRAAMLGAWIPTAAGRYAVIVDDPLISREPASTPTAIVDVWLPDDELRTPDTDHPRLQSIADRTGGIVLRNADELAQLPELLPKRGSVIVSTPDTDPLWDTPLALILVLALLAFEWVTRRLLRLV